MSYRQDISLGDLIEIKHGYAFKGQYFSNDATDNILVTPGNFEIGGGFKSTKLKYYDGPVDDEYVLRANDLIVTMTDLSKEGDTLGYSARVPSENSKRFLHNQRIGLVKLKSDIVDEDYIYWILRSPKYHEYVVATATGSTVKHTSPRRINNYIVMVPDKNQQRLIANLLRAIDEKIYVNRQMNITLDQICHTLFNHYFIDNLDYNVWPIGKVSDLGTVITGKTPPKKNVDFFEGEMLFLKIPDMHDQSLIIKTGDSLTEAGASSQRNKTLPRYSTCVSCIATVGIVSLTTENTQTNQQINSIVPRNNYRFYNYFLIQTMSEKLRSMASGGTATLNLNKGLFENIKVALPPDDLLVEFDNLVSPIIDQLENNLIQNERLASLQSSLLPRLISGKIMI